MSTSATAAVTENSKTAISPLAASRGDRRGWAGKIVSVSEDFLILIGGVQSKYEVINGHYRVTLWSWIKAQCGS